MTTIFFLSDYELQYILEFFSNYEYPLLRLVCKKWKDILDNIYSKSFPPFELVLSSYYRTRDNISYFINVSNNVMLKFASIINDIELFEKHYNIKSSVDKHIIYKCAKYAGLNNGKNISQYLLTLKNYRILYDSSLRNSYPHHTIVWQLINACIRANNIKFFEELIEWLHKTQINYLQNATMCVRRILKYDRIDFMDFLCDHIYPLGDDNDITIENYIVSYSLGMYGSSDMIHTIYLKFDISECIIRGLAERGDLDMIKSTYDLLEDVWNYMINESDISAITELLPANGDDALAEYILGIVGETDCYGRSLRQSIIRGACEYNNINIAENYIKQYNFGRDAIDYAIDFDRGEILSIAISNDPSLIKYTLDKINRGMHIGSEVSKLIANYQDNC